MGIEIDPKRTSHRTFNTAQTFLFLIAYSFKKNLNFESKRSKRKIRKKILGEIITKKKILYGGYAPYTNMMLAWKSAKF